MFRVMIMSVIFSCSLIAADIGAFGATINKTSLLDLDKLECEIKETTNYHRILDGSCFEIDGLKSVVYVARDGIIKRITAIINKNEFENINKGLHKKYGKPKKKIIPFVGNSYVRWIKDGSSIILDAPHLSFEMTLEYVDLKYEKEIDDYSKETEEIKSEKLQDTI